MRPIDSRAYQAIASTLTPEEVRLRELFKEWLPEKVIDCHCHSNLPEHVLFIPDQAYSHMLSTFPSFSIDDSERFFDLLFPGKHVRALRFANAFRGIDHRKANGYLSTRSSKDDRMALYGLPDDIPYTLKMLRKLRPAALKMYYSYCTPPATQISQYFPFEVLVEAEKLGIPIILHPPIHVAKCLGQVIDLARAFPYLKIVLAHMGLAYTLTPELEGAYKQLAKFENIYLDTSLIPSSEVLVLAMRVFGASKIMYGSDQPLNLIRSRVYDNPKLGLRLITDYPYHWVDPAEHAEFGHLAAGVVHNHWSTLIAIKDAVSSLAGRELASTKEKIFNDNAEKLFGF